MMYPPMGIAPSAMRRPRAQDDNDLAKRIEALETEVTALKARIEKLEQGTDPAEPEARASGWKAAIAHVTRG